MLPLPQASRGEPGVRLHPPVLDVRAASHGLRAQALGFADGFQCRDALLKTSVSGARAPTRGSRPPLCGTPQGEGSACPSVRRTVDQYRRAVAAMWSIGARSLQRKPPLVPLPRALARRANVGPPRRRCARAHVAPQHAAPDPPVLDASRDHGPRRQRAGLGRDLRAGPRESPFDNLRSPLHPAELLQCLRDLRQHRPADELVALLLADGEGREGHPHNFARSRGSGE